MITLQRVVLRAADPSHAPALAPSRFGTIQRPGTFLGDPFCVRLDRSGPSLSVAVTLRASPVPTETVTLQGLVDPASEGVFGQVGPVEVPPERWSVDGTATVSSPLAVRTLGSSGVRVSRVVWKWETGQPGITISPDRSETRLYEILSEPKTPWGDGTSRTMPNDVAWPEALEKACEWAAGARTASACAAGIVRGLAADALPGPTPLLLYDPHGSDLVAPLLTPSVLKCAKFLTTLNTGTGLLRVSCLATSALVTTFANILGVGLQPAELAAADDGTFSINQVKPLGGVGPMRQREFAFHVMAVSGDPPAPGPTSAVFDGAFMIDADDRPQSDPTWELVSGRRLGRPVDSPGQGFYLPQLLADDAVVEPLAPRAFSFIERAPRLGPISPTALRRYQLYLRRLEAVPIIPRDSFNQLDLRGFSGLVSEPLDLGFVRDDQLPPLPPMTVTEGQRNGAERIEVTASEPGDPVAARSLAAEWLAMSPVPLRERKVGDRTIFVSPLDTLAVYVEGGRAVAVRSNGWRDFEVLRFLDRALPK